MPVLHLHARRSINGQLMVLFHANGPCKKYLLIIIQEFPQHFVVAKTSLEFIGGNATPSVPLVLHDSRLACTRLTALSTRK